MNESRSFLVVTWEGGGNVPPVLGLARRLVKQGHDVRVLTEPCLEPAVAQLGARFIPFTRHFTRTDRTEDLVRDWEGKTPLGSLRRAFDNLLFGPIGIVAEETQRAMQQEKPDAVLVDLNMLGALMAAEAADIPRVVLFHMPEYLPGPGRPAAGPGFHPRSDLIGRLRDGLFIRLFMRLLKGYLGTVNDARRGLGLEPLGGPKEILDMYHRADLRLIQTTRAFDFPITPPPKNVRYVGPVLDDPDWIDAGQWDNPWPADDTRPLVVVSLSSTFQNQRDVLQGAITALGGMEVRGLVTLGPAMAGARFDLPQNVVAVASASHAQIFPHAAAVVTHAGHGTIMRSLASGVPVVCLPMGRDQNDNAARVTVHGVGLALKPSAKPAEIRSAILRVLDEPRFRVQAQHLSRQIAEDAASERAVHEIEALVGATNPAVRADSALHVPSPS